MRLVIFGNSGSGKSTLAKHLASQHDLTHLDLDTLAWEPEQPGVRRALEDSLRDLDHFLRHHAAWVIEGCYSDLLAHTLERCSRLFFLNPGVEACIANCRARPFEPHKYDSPEAQDQNLAMLIDWVRTYPTRDDEFSLRCHQALFNRFEGDKVEYRENVSLD